MIRTTTGASAPSVQAEATPPDTEIVADPDDPPATAPIAVTVIQPRLGAVERLTTQPGSVQAYESVQLFAKVPGFLKSQTVDIGDRIKRDMVLAVVDVPELKKQVQRNEAALEQTRARVLQMKARLTSAQADLDAAHAEVKHAEATAKSSAAWVRYRQKQLTRMQDLFANKSIEERLVDEHKDNYEASVETENAAQAAILTTKAKVAASNAKILQAQADVDEAQAEVKVAQAELEKAQVQVSFATIVAPFDGVVTSRTMFPGDFVRGANESNVPLLTVQRTDMMRVVVQVPDRDVMYVDAGDPATFEIDALPGMKFHAKVSRLAHSQDPQTRLMRVEIDLPNPTGKIRNGMYGRVTILLDKAADKLSIPTSCLANRSTDGAKGTVYVVSDGHAHLTTVRLGEDNGLRVAVLEGLVAGDHVVLNPGHAIHDGAEVTATLEAEVPTKNVP